MDIRLDDADKASLDLLCVRFRKIPKIAIDAPFAGGEHGQLRTALTAMAEKRRGVEHLIPVFRRERIRERLPGPQRRAVASGENADLPLRDRHLLLASVDRVDHIEQGADMESRGKDLGLRAIFAVRGDNPAFGQGTATVYTEQMAEMTVGHENERRRGESEQYDDDANSTRAIVHSPGTILHGNDRWDREQEQPHNDKGHLGHRLLPSNSPDIVRNGCTHRGQSVFRHRPNYSQTGVNCTAGSRLRVAPYSQPVSPRPRLLKPQLLTSPQLN